MLTDHQSQKLEEAMTHLSTNDRLLIKGSAGTGKTYLCDELVKKLLPTVSEYVYCTAPTNQAVSVLHSKITATGKLAFMSTHAALKMKRVINDDTGDISFEPMFSPNCEPLSNVSILIIDESSMIGKTLLGYIEEWAYKSGCKVIFLGDAKQLPPVNENGTPVFDAGYPEIELTEIIRQKGGNPIIDLSFNLDLLKKKEDNLIRKEEPPTLEGYVFSNDFEKIIERLTISNGSDLYKYIGYTNEEVNKINSIVRNRLYGNKPKRIELGETMIFDAPYGKDYSTNDKIKVEKVVVLKKSFEYIPFFKRVTLIYYLINYEGEDVKSMIGGIKVLHEDSDEDFKRVKKEMKMMAKRKEIKWIDYYRFIEQFAQLKYNHAMTCHKINLGLV